MSAGGGCFGAVVVRTVTVWSPPHAGRDPGEKPPCP
jgi:hypothetical protein